MVNILLTQVEQVHFQCTVISKQLADHGMYFVSLHVLSRALCCFIHNFISKLIPKPKLIKNKHKIKQTQNLLFIIKFKYLSVFTYSSYTLSAQKNVLVVQQPILTLMAGQHMKMDLEVLQGITGLVLLKYVDFSH